MKTPTTPDVMGMGKYLFLCHFQHLMDAVMAILVEKQFIFILTKLPLYIYDLLLSEDKTVNYCLRNFFAYFFLLRSSIKIFPCEQIVISIGVISNWDWKNVLKIWKYGCHVSTMRWKRCRGFFLVEVSRQEHPT